MKPGRKRDPKIKCQNCGYRDQPHMSRKVFPRFFKDEPRKILCTTCFDKESLAYRARRLVLECKKMVERFKKAKIAEPNIVGLLEHHHD